MRSDTEAHATLTVDLDERDFYPTIVHHARLLGWSVVYLPPARTSQRDGTPVWRTVVSQDGVGLPDFFFVLGRTRSGRPGHAIWVEVKRDAKPVVVGPHGNKLGRPGVLSHKQDEWGERLVAAGQRYFVFYVPSQMDELIALLTDLALS